MQSDPLLYAEPNYRAKTIEPGTRFGKLVVLGYMEDPRPGAYWLCQCDCGSEVTRAGGSLRAGLTISCGCAQKPRGWYRSPAWHSWWGMKNRCLNPNDTHYEYYGGRGITVCDRWLEFTNFLADMGERPAGLTLDRVDTDGDYEPGNCRWATWSEQRMNQRRMAAHAG